MALAARHGWKHVDTDDVFWLKTDPLFTDIRPRAERVALMRAELDRAKLDAAASWVVSGSLCGWGDVFIPRFDLVVFLAALPCPVLWIEGTQPVTDSVAAVEQALGAKADNPPPMG